MRDPAKYAYYKKKAKKLGVTSAYTAAITEYMRKGRIEHVDTSRLAQEGQVSVWATRGKRELTSVVVRVTSKEGKELARGPAVRSGIGIWTYHHRGNAVAWNNVTISAEAKDKAGIQ